NHPGGELMLALAEDAGRREQHLGPLLGRPGAPGREILVGLSNTLAGELRIGGRVHADYLLGMRRIPRAEALARLDPLTADAQRVFASQPRANFGESGLHGRPILGLGEIAKRLVAKWGKSHGALTIV